MCSIEGSHLYKGTISCVAWQKGEQILEHWKTFNLDMATHYSRMTQWHAI